MRDDGAFEVINPGGGAALLITADHASNHVPEDLASLGLPATELARHIAHDIGVAGVVRRLAAELGATAVLARFSRLVIDANRALGEADCIPGRSDGTPIPGNLNLTPAERAWRAHRFYDPYHAAIDREIARLRTRARSPAVLSVHSFTPALLAGGTLRPWHIGVMYSFDRTLADVFFHGLAGRPDIVVGENEPYSGMLWSYALKRHALAQGLAHAQLEIRQDLIATEAGQATWAGTLAAILRPWLERSRGEARNG